MHENVINTRFCARSVKRPHESQVKSAPSNDRATSSTRALSGSNVSLPDFFGLSWSASEQMSRSTEAGPSKELEAAVASDIITGLGEPKVVLHPGYEAAVAAAVASKGCRP
jgi:hypothetical protein